MPLYFAYGSCMNLNDLTRSGIEATFVDTAVVINYRLAFSRYSYYRKGGVADIVKAKRKMVEGVLFEVPNFKTLDLREGAPWVYRRIRVRVYPRKSRGWKWAWTYEVVNKASVEFAPSKEYADIIREGAQVLSVEYQKELQKLLFQTKGRC